MKLPLMGHLNMNIHCHTLLVLFMLGETEDIMHISILLFYVFTMFIYLCSCTHSIIRSMHESVHQLMSLSKLNLVSYNVYIV